MKVPTRRGASLFVLVFLLVTTRLQGGGSFPRLIADAENPERNRLEFLKDPCAAVLAIPGVCDQPEPFIMLGDYGRGKFRMFHLSTLDDFAIREEVEIVMPERERVYQRWAPDLLVEGDTLWISYAMGRVDRHGVEWPTFRLYGAKAKIPAKGEAPRITFTGEREIVVLDTGKFQGAGDYGIIDPEIFRNSDGQLYLYYNVVLHGIPGKRWRTGPICSQRMRDPWTPYGQGDEKLAWAGDAGPPDAGVAESPSIIKREKDYLMFYSARPSDKDQCIVMLRSKVPHGDAWKDRRVVMSTRTEDAPLMLAKASYERLGVGGQDALQYGGETYLIYQALGAESDGGHQTDIFRAAILKLPHEVIH